MRQLPTNEGRRVTFADGRFDYLNHNLIADFKRGECGRGTAVFGFSAVVLVRVGQFALGGKVAVAGKSAVDESRLHTR